MALGISYCDKIPIYLIYFYILKRDYTCTRGLSQGYHSQKAMPMKRLIMTATAVMLGMKPGDRATEVVG